MFYQFAISAILLVPFVGALPAQVALDDWYLLLICAAFFTAAPHVLFANSISKISAKTAGLVACLQPLYGTIWGLILLSEVPSISTLIGGAIIVGAALYETAQSNKRTVK